MEQKFFNILEYDKIINIICGFCSTYIGKEKAASLLPSCDKAVVKSLLD